MYPTSERFHQAIRESQPQMPLIMFKDAVITNQDINISSGGMKFSESTGDQEDFAPGGCAASTLSFSLFNDDGTWTEYLFGSCVASLGVRTYDGIVGATDANCGVNFEGRMFYGYSTPPYIRSPGLTLAASGAWPVMAMAAYNGTLYAFGEGGRIAYFKWTHTLVQQGIFNGTWAPVKSYTWGELKQFTWGEVMNEEKKNLGDVAILLRLSERWVKYRLGISLGYKVAQDTAPKAENCLNVYRVQGGQLWLDGYEMVPLGHFIADKPKYSSKQQITVSCYDVVTLLDAYYDKRLFSGAMTLGQFFGRICEAVGLQAESLSFVNSGYTIEPGKIAEFEDSTYREIVKWLGEVTGCFCRATRDGKLAMRWFTQAGYTLAKTDYSECNTAYYNAAPVSKIVVRSSDADDRVTGDGQNAVYIQNNPIANALKG